MHLFWRGCWEVGILYISGDNVNEPNLQRGYLGSIFRNPKKQSLTQKFHFTDVLLQVQQQTGKMAEGSPCGFAAFLTVAKSQRHAKYHQQGTCYINYGMSIPWNSLHLQIDCIHSFIQPVGVVCLSWARFCGRDWE